MYGLTRPVKGWRKVKGKARTIRPAESPWATLRGVIRELEELAQIRADLMVEREQLLAQLQREAVNVPEVIDQVETDVEAVLGPNYPTGGTMFPQPRHDV